MPKKSVNYNNAEEVTEEVLAKLEKKRDKLVNDLTEVLLNITIVKIHMASSISLDDYFDEFQHLVNKDKILDTDDYKVKIGRYGKLTD